MIIPGYVDSDAGPFDLFSCAPKAGIWIFAATAANATEDDLAGLNPNGGGVTSMSVGFCDAQGGQKVANYGGSNAGFDFTSTGTGITNSLTGATSSFSDKDVSTVLDLLGIGTPGWQILSSGLGTNLRGYYLALLGDTMESVVGQFTLPADGSPVSVSGLGFNPDLIIFAGAGTSAAGGVMSIGALDADDNQWGFGFSNGYINGPDLHKQAFQGILDACLVTPPMTGFAGAVGWEASGSIVAGGFDITQVDAPPSDVVYTYIAIRDPNGGFAVGSGDISDGASGLGFAPEAVMMATVWQGDQASHPHGGISAGIAAVDDPDAPSPSPITGNMGSVFTEQDQQETAGAGTRWRSTFDDSTLIQYDVGGSLLSSCDVDSFTAGGFTTGVLGSGLAGWIAMRGSDQGGCFSSFRPQIYRLVLR